MFFLSNLLSFFKRDTGSKQFIPTIDGLRSLALLPVIIMHFNTNYKRYLGTSLGDGYERVVGNGERGVYLFFAISGFILSLGFFNSFKRNEGINYSKYFLRRLTRLEPPFIISTLIFFALVQLSYEGKMTELLKHLLATLTYTHYLCFGTWSIINPVTWSLEVEIQFYLLIPFFCAFLFNKSEKIRLILLTLLVIILPFIFSHENSFFRTNIHLRKSLPVFLGYFMVGVLFLTFYTSSIWQKVKESYFLDILGGTAIVLLFSLEFHNNRPLEQVVVCFLIFLIFIAAFKGIFLKQLFSVNIIVIFGGMCYSIYLLHYAIVFGISKLSKNFILQDNTANYILQFIITFLGILIISSIFYILFEKPFMKHKWWKTIFSRG